MQLFGRQKQRTALAAVWRQADKLRGFCRPCIFFAKRQRLIFNTRSLTAVPHSRCDGIRTTRKYIHTLLVFFFVSVCAPAKDTVLSDVERNYTATGFLDTDTFQIICVLPSAGEDRLSICRQKLIAALVEYKERYEREASARRMHQDFLPFFRPAEVTDAQREEWRRFYQVLAEGRSRIVFERAIGDGFEGVYRLRLRDLIYRVQKAQ